MHRRTNDEAMILKQHVSFRTKYKTLLFLQQFRILNYFKFHIVDATRNQAYIFLAADYANLGDVAITYAQTRFIKNNSKYQVIEIPISQSLEGLWFVKRNCKKGDLITLVGGGNMGELYDQIEFIRQLVIKTFPNNRIISFPQTIDFGNSVEGKKALMHAKAVYNLHSDLHLVAREQTSYDLMSQYFPKAKVYLTPDIVLSLEEREPAMKREGALVCLRDDEEKALSAEQGQWLTGKVSQKFTNVRFYDTHISGSELSVTDRREQLYRIWNAFRKAELVITDRLHGMIFSQITGTPALVFQNKNHKIRDTFDWIKANKMMTLIPQFNEDEISRFFDDFKYKRTKILQLTDKYQPLIELFTGSVAVNDNTQ